MSDDVVITRDDAEELMRLADLMKERLIGQTNYEGACAYRDLSDRIRAALSQEPPQ